MVDSKLLIFYVYDYCVESLGSVLFLEENINLHAKIPDGVISLNDRPKAKRFDVMRLRWISSSQSIEIVNGKMFDGMVVNWKPTSIKP